MKMYILMLNDLSHGYAINSAAHASLACYLKYQDDSNMVEWVNDHFKKVTCKVSEGELKKALSTDIPHVVITESRLDGRVMGAAFVPQEEWPKCFKYFELYR